MLKIIVAFDSLRPSKSAVLYAAEFAKSLDAHLVAVFLDDFTNRSYKSYQILHDRFSVSKETYDVCNEQDDLLRKEAVLHFEETARKENLNYTIHHDRNISLNELISESIYSDLLIIESKETMAFYAENPPTHFIKNLLEKIHCPVLIVPEEYKKTTQVLFLYDGESNSTTAIKMFSYLLPVYSDAQVEVLTVKSKKQDLKSPNNYLMKEYMKRHYPNAIYTVLNGL
ncbi:MAG TPA: universal stress protein, partial [Puia sp.]